jgi:hypothetical protein
LPCSLYLCCLPPFQLPIHLSNLYCCMYSFINCIINSHFDLKNMWKTAGVNTSMPVLNIINQSFVEIYFATTAITITGAWNKISSLHFLPFILLAKIWALVC